MAYQIYYEQGGNEMELEKVMITIMYDKTEIFGVQNQHKKNDKNEMELEKVMITIIYDKTAIFGVQNQQKKEITM